MTHVPSRTCVACRRARAKHELVRIARRPDGSVVVDPSARESGRGAYVCRTAECIAGAPAQLPRALRARTTRAEMRDALAGVGER
jgi:predicted RNA-binding protein YlxR (DUF448 family)